MTGFRIAWAGPWNERSAIATFGIHVVGALAEAGHAVEILRTETAEYLQIPAPATPWKVRALAEDTAERIRAGCDVVIANMGDHFGYHGALVPFRQALDPVFIFHDCYLGNFCGGWAEQFPDPDETLRIMARATYGAASLPDWAPFELPPSEMIRKRPMIDLFTPWATGAVVHADHYLERVRRRCPGPVAKIPLAYPGLVVPPPQDGPGLTVVTVGHVNANKRAAEVIAAIGSSAGLRAHCAYRLVGFVEDAERRRLDALAQAHGVTSLAFTGWVDDAGLRAELAGADVICCLRDPILEGGSSSLITAMLAGRPVLVSNHGVYGELPDDVVLKCRPGAEAVDVARHLKALLVDRAAGQALAARARAYAVERHSPSRYARDLLALVERALAAGPAIRTGRAFGALLGSMGLEREGPEQADPAAARVAGVLAGLLDPPAGC